MRKIVTALGSIAMLGLLIAGTSNAASASPAHGTFTAVPVSPAHGKTAATVAHNSRSAACCFYDGPIYNELGAPSGVKCLDADLNTIGADGTKVQLWTCNRQQQQNWFYESDGTIRNSYSGRCLDADRNTAFRLGGKVQLWDCNGSPQQTWDSHYPGGVAAGRVVFTDELDGLCLDADTNTIGRDGTFVQRWSCNGTGQQSWYGIGWP